MREISSVEISDPKPKKKTHLKRCVKLKNFAMQIGIAKIV